MLWRKRHMGDTASLGLSMARTSEACAAVVILVWRCQFTVVSACLGTPQHAGVASADLCANRTRVPVARGLEPSLEYYTLTQTAARLEARPTHGHAPNEGATRISLYAL